MNSWTCTGFKTHYVPTSEEFKVLQKNATEFDWDAYNKWILSDGYVTWFNERPPEVQDAMNSMPFTKYYTDKESRTKVYRIYGVAQVGDDKKCYYHVAEAKFIRIADFLLSKEDLVLIEEWNQEHLETIKLCGHPGLFLMPDGWTTIASILQ